LTTIDFELKNENRIGLDIAKGLRWERKPRDYIFPGFKTKTIGALFAPGGTGKSFLALELAIAIANNQADIAGFQPTSEGKVLYVNAEDDEDELNDRLSCCGERINPSLDEIIDENLIILPAMGGLQDYGWRSSKGEVSKELIDLIDFAKGYRLIILDTLTRFHRLNENDNGQMSQLLGNLEYVVKQTGASLLFIHHTNKAAAKDGELCGQLAARGADAIISNIRYAAFLHKMTGDEANKYGIDQNRQGFYLRFGVAKQNNGQPQSDRWLERKEGGVLLPVDLVSKTETNKTSRKERKIEKYYL
jgi:RecA-family ATPase